MEKLNIEIIISTLFKMGYKKVDEKLYNSILKQILIENEQNNTFYFVDEQPSTFFTNYVHFDGKAYRLKDGITLTTNITPVLNREFQFGDSLSSSDVLIEFLSSYNTMRKGR